MKVSPDSREGRVLLAREYVREARVTWRSIPWDVSTMTMPNAVGVAHGVELMVKAAVLCANETPATDHGLEALWGRAPFEATVTARYEPLVRQAAVIRKDGGYPGSPGYEALTTGMDQSSWSVFRLDGEALVTVIEGVAKFLAGDGPRPPTWRGPGPSRSR